MPKSVGVYLGEQALANLDNIRTFFTMLGGTSPSDSVLISNAIQTQAWFLSAIFGQPKCPNAACGAEIKVGVPECPACQSAIKWLPTLDMAQFLAFIAKAVKDSRTTMEHKEPR